MAVKGSGEEYNHFVVVDDDDDDDDDIVYVFGLFDVMKRN